MVLEFSLVDAGNDWWWAIDNLEITGIGGTGGIVTPLQAGDADQDLDFDQLDLVKVQVAAKYLTGQPATWGEGDWNAAPGGSVGSPPQGDGQFNQLDIIAALNHGLYLTGSYGATAGAGSADFAAVPEPATMMLLICGAMGLAIMGSRRRARR
jgi:hypothetical protein